LFIEARVSGVVVAEHLSVGGQGLHVQVQRAVEVAEGLRVSAQTLHRPQGVPAEQQGGSGEVVSRQSAC
jgi:hypothetical protein